MLELTDTQYLPGPAETFNYQAKDSSKMSINQKVQYRLATCHDHVDLIALRLAYLTEDSGKPSETDAANIEKRLSDYFARHLNYNFFAILAETNDRVVGTAFLLILEIPAAPRFPTGKTGTLMNVYVRPEYRRYGIATELLNCLIAIGKEQDLSYIELMATAAGKPLYEKLGFIAVSSPYLAMKLNFM